MIPPDDQTSGTTAGAAVTGPRPGRTLWWIIGAVVVILAIVLFARHRAAAAVRAPGGRFGNAPLVVGVARVTTGDVPITINALGTVTPLATVTVHPQVTGPLTKVSFTEGQTVKAGDLLVQIDPRPYQAVLDQAVGQLKRDQALLANARVDLERYKTLLAQNSISEQTHATQVATVAQDEATVAADQAAVEAAQLSLSYCRITSPVPGLVGLRQVDVGNLMQANSTSIVVVTQMQPMSVLFTVPEDSLNDILKRMRAGQKLGVDAYDRSVTSKIASGVLSNADNEIDTTTGTLKLRAMFDNASYELFPNQFVNVLLLLDTLHDVIVVPGASIQQGASGSYVYVVNPDSTVKMRAVVTGPTSADLVSIKTGLTAGETVVVDGADQLRDGARVTLPGQAGATTVKGRGKGRGNGNGNGNTGDGSGGNRADAGSSGDGSS
ncbi:MAG TPA: efflux RND transporter periplasmic adaptor subunit, partial [Steroidobacteraceae bacterium]|nr:efflux RND transporter periplasmic adaptor subunit [Steroidobacteraceae bacterium]